MRSRQILIAPILWAMTLPYAGPSSAATQTATDSEDDATVTLSVDDTYIIGVTTDWCSVRVHVVGTDVAFTTGDEVRVSVWEEDLVGDDLLFETIFVVTASEVSQQLVDRTFDCSNDLDLFEPLPDAEVSAEALVTKDACGTFCSDDNPRTTVLTIPFTVVTAVGATEASPLGEREGAVSIDAPHNPTETFRRRELDPRGIRPAADDDARRLHLNNKPARNVVRRLLTVL